MTPRHLSQQFEPPEPWIPPTGSVRPGVWWSAGVVDQQHSAKAAY